MDDTVIPSLPPELAHAVRGFEGKQVQLIYSPTHYHTDSLHLVQVDGRGAPVAIAQNGGAQTGLTFTQGAEMASKPPKKPQGAGPEIDATAKRGGVQENFQNEGANARIKATADGGTQKGFVNKGVNSPQPEKKGWLHSPGGVALVGAAAIVIAALIAGVAQYVSAKSQKENADTAHTTSAPDAGVGAHDAGTSSVSR